MPRKSPPPPEPRCRVHGCTEPRFSARYCVQHEVRLLRILEKHRAIRERNERARAATLDAVNLLDRLPRRASA
jgi:hypothetical protein